jgi:amino acid permease
MQSAERRETEPLLGHGSAEPDTNGEDRAVIETGRLHRSLTARQVQMIALGGTLGTGLFLGTGRSLAAGGPGTMLVCYSITGFIV